MEGKLSSAILPTQEPSRKSTSLEVALFLCFLNFFSQGHSPISAEDSAGRCDGWTVVQASSGGVISELPTPCTALRYPLHCESGKPGRSSKLWETSLFSLGERLKTSKS